MEEDFSEQEIPEQYNGKIKRLRNIPRFKDFTDWELYQIVLRKEKVREEKQLITITDEAGANKLSKRFEQKLSALQKEFGVDMNDSNDAESLKQLIRFLIQQEDTDQDIRRVKEELKADPVTLSRTLKSYGDFQRSLTMSINELQEKLGINRKARKEKQTDDIPQYIESLRKRAQDFWKRSTTPITCPTCMIELARIWINFPDMEHELEGRFVCWKCKEQVLWKN
jgi:tetratricopeptide (TPR) repeat protein